MSGIEARAVTDPTLRAEVLERLRGIQEALAGLTAELHEAMAMVPQCDGEKDGEPCILSGVHNGRHRSESGVEWLED